MADLHSHATSPRRAPAITTLVARLLVVIGCGVFSAAMPAFAVEPEACAGLAKQDFGDIEDAPTQVLSATHIEATDQLPAYCHVETYINPNIGMNLYLPMNNWNGKFLKRGCGGSCGQMYFNPWMTLCKTTLPRGYACILEDMGHRSTSLDSKWSHNNLQAQVDYAFRSTYLTTVAGKHIVRRFYGRPIERSYFLGGSTGGQQGLLLAQRFPFEYDGIMAGAPAITGARGSRGNLAWSAAANLDANGRRIMHPEHVRILHAAVLAKCDGHDGVRDGVIGDPERCDFEPKSLICGKGKSGDCLTAEQAEVARKIYQGPVDSSGRVVARGPAMGSELNWISNYIGVDESPSVYVRMTADNERFRYSPINMPPMSLRDRRWDVEPGRITMVEIMRETSNPDLRDFRDAGGKLLMWHGLSDQSVLPWGAIDYYEMLERAMGGEQKTQEFARFFLLPGVNHVYRGAGADAVDWLAYLEAWVERGEAPNNVIGVHVKELGKESDMIPMRPFTRDEIAFTRPHFPYPLRYRYSGKGDPNDAASFVPHRPRKPR